MSFRPLVLPVVGSGGREEEGGTADDVEWTLRSRSRSRSRSPPRKLLSFAFALPPRKLASLEPPWTLLSRTESPSTSRPTERSSTD